MQKQFNRKAWIPLIYSGYSDKQNKAIIFFPGISLFLCHSKNTLFLFQEVFKYNWM